MARPVQPPAPVAVPSALPPQRPPAAGAPMRGMDPPMSRGEPPVLRERERDRRFDERPRMEMRGEPQRIDPMPRGPGEPSGRMFRQREQ